MSKSVSLFLASALALSSVFAREAPRTTPVDSAAGKPVTCNDPKTDKAALCFSGVAGKAFTAKNKNGCPYYMELAVMAHLQDFKTYPDLRDKAMMEPLENAFRATLAQYPNVDFLNKDKSPGFDALEAAMQGVINDYNKAHNVHTRFTTNRHHWRTPEGYVCTDGDRGMQSRPA